MRQSGQLTLWRRVLQPLGIHAAEGSPSKKMLTDRQCRAAQTCLSCAALCEVLSPGAFMAIVSLDPSAYLGHADAHGSPEMDGVKLSLPDQPVEQMATDAERFGRLRQRE